MSDRPVQHPRQTSPTKQQSVRVATILPARSDAVVTWVLAPIVCKTGDLHTFPNRMLTFFFTRTEKSVRLALVSDDQFFIETFNLVQPRVAGVKLIAVKNWEVCHYFFTCSCSYFSIILIIKNGLFQGCTAPRADFF